MGSGRAADNEQVAEAYQLFLMQLGKRPRERLPVAAAR